MTGVPTIQGGVQPCSRRNQGQYVVMQNRMVLPFQDPTAAALVVLDGIADAGQAGAASATASGSWTMTPPTAPPSAVRILSALELRPHTWTRIGPRSIEHAGLRVRLTLGIASVRIAHIIPGGDPVPVQAVPATRDRIAELLEDRLRCASGADLDPDAIAQGSGDIG